MIYTLYKAGQQYHFIGPGETLPEGSPLNFDNPEVAESFLRSFILFDSWAMDSFRGLHFECRGGWGGSSEPDHVILEQLGADLENQTARVTEHSLGATPVPTTSEDSEEAEAEAEGSESEEEPEETSEDTWIKYRVIDGKTGKPVEGVQWKATLPDESEQSGSSDGDGSLEFDGIPSGTTTLVSELSNATRDQTLEVVGEGEMEETDEESDLPSGTYRICEVERYKVKTGDSILSLAEANGMTWQELAKFNWDTDDPNEINEHLANEVGCTIKVDQYNYRFDDSDSPGIMLIPKKWEKSGLSTTSTHTFQVRPVENVYTLFNVHWNLPETKCGEMPELHWDTTLEGEPDFEIRLETIGGNFTSSARIRTATDGHGVLHEIIQNIGFDEGESFVETVELVATVTEPESGATGSATIIVKALLDGDTETHHSGDWTSNSYTFEQSLEDFRTIALLDLKIMKGWGGTYIDLSDAGITGTAGGCPWSGNRWARSTGGEMRPDEYYDGTSWLPLPSGYVLSSEDYHGMAFVKDGTEFKSKSGYVWPESFDDYDFSAEEYTDVRDKWIELSNDKWSDVFPLRRVDCFSEPDIQCCLYSVGVEMTFTETTTWTDDVVVMAPGNLRSNARLWFMGDDRDYLGPHEAGHHLDNPDEYEGGTVDPDVNEDGAVNGVDPTTIMGSGTRVKYRHYQAFADTLKTIIGNKYGESDDYEVVYWWEGFEG